MSVNKKSVYNIIYTVLGLFYLVSCGVNSVDPVPTTKYNVVFKENKPGILPVDAKITNIPGVAAIESGAKMTKPSDPVLFGYTFEGWSESSLGTPIFNFNTSITKTTTLFAIWKLIPINGISITSSPGTKIGTPLTLTATVDPANAVQFVNWSIVGIAPAGVTISEGVLTTIPGVTEIGSFTVTAIGLVDQSKTASQIIVLTPPDPTGIAITTATSTTIGVDLLLSATIFPVSTVQDVIWSIEGGNPAGVSVENNVLKTTVGITTVTTFRLVATSSIKNTLRETQDITLLPRPTSVDITSADTTIIGVDLNLMATVLPGDAVQTVVWSLNGTPLGISIVDGVLKTIGGIATPGTVTVIASAMVDRTITKTKIVTLESSTAPAPTSISITSANSVEIGVDLNLMATVQPASALQTVTWSIDGTPAGVDIINGVLKTVGGVAATGPITVVVTSTVDTSKTNTQTITLQAPTAPAPTGVSITSASSTKIGVDLNLVATVQPTDALQTVTWALNGSPAGVEIINGVLKSIAGTAAVGTIEVTATSTVDTSKTAIQTITLEAPTAPTTVSITSANSVEIGMDLNLTATVQPADALQTVTWTLNGSPAGVEIINGVLITTGGVANVGTISVTATSIVDTSKSDTQTITLQAPTAPAPTGVSITSANSVEIGMDLNLTATVQPTDALQTVTWTVSGSPNGVSIVNGVLKTVGGVATAGTISVTATSTVDTSKSDTQTITLQAPTAPAPTGVSITSANSVEIGMDLNLTATVQPTDALQTVTWTLNGSPNGVKIENGVLITTGGVAAAGTISVTATSTVDTSKSDTQTISLQAPTAPVPTGVSITSASSIQIGVDLNLTASVQPTDALQTVTWTVSGSPNGVKIENGVLITTVGTATVGTISVTATSTVDTSKFDTQSISLQAPLAPAPTAVSITSASNTEIGVDLNLTATVQPTDALQSVTWTVSGSPNGVKIENGVLITTGGVAAVGTISVIATSTVDTTKTDTQTITLQAPTASAPTGVSITSANSVEIGMDLNLTATVQPTDALQTVTWTVSGLPNGVSIVNGVLKTIGGVAAAGTISVTATSTVDTSKSDTQTITLQAPTASAPTSVSITSASSIQIGVDLNLTATVQPTSALQTVIWTVSGSPAGVEVVNGVLKTIGGVAATGPISVTAISTVDTSKSDTQTITLQAPTAPAPTAVSITSRSTEIGVDLNLIATVLPTGALQSVAWTLNGSPNGVKIENGVLKTIGGVAATGPISVTATSTVDTSKSDTQTIALQAPTAPAPTAVSITSADTTIIGVDLNLTATVQPPEALQTVTWSIDGTPAGVDIINGVLKTVGGVAATGPITVVVTSTVDTSKTNTQTITLKASTAPAPTAVAITSADTTIIGVDLNLTATVLPTGALQTVIWTVSGSPNGVEVVNGVLKTIGGVAATGPISVTAISTVDTSKSDTQTITLQAPTAPAPTSVSITSRSTQIGVDLNLTATVLPAGALQTVTWTLNGSPNGVEIINGVLKSIAGTAAVGTISVTAASTVDASKSDIQSITLQAPAPTAVSITSASSTEIGVDLNLAATVLPAGALQTVNWTLNGSPNGVKIENGVLITTGGVATADAISVTATSTVDTTKSVTQSIRLQAPSAPAPTAVSITSLIAEIGVDLNLTATVQPTDALQTVTWTLNGSPAGVEITNGVLKTIGGTATVDTISVTATSTVDTSKSDTQSITLQAPTAPAPTSVSITSASSTEIGVDLNLTATVLPTGALQTVIWTVSGSPNGVKIENGVLKTTGGIVTADKITVTATSTVDTSKSDTQTITLQAPSAPTPTAVSITSLIAEIGVNLNLMATVQPTDALQTVTWTLTGSPNGVKIENGVLITTGGVAAAGTIIVTATSTVDTSKSDTQSITLQAPTAPAPTAVSITSASSTEIGVDLKLTATVQPTDALQTVTWTLIGSISGVEIIDGVLKTTGGVTPTGAIIVTATSTVDTSKNVIQSIELQAPTAPAPTAVSITSLSAEIGVDLNLTATVQPTDALQTVTWTLNGSPAGVEIIEGVLKTTGGTAAVGTIEVTATSTVDTSKSDTQTITLQTPAPTTVSITSLSAEIGVDLNLTATVLPAGALQTLTWTLNGSPAGVEIIEEVLKTTGGVVSVGAISVTATSTVDTSKSDTKTITLQAPTAPAPTAVSITSLIAEIGVDLNLTATVQPTDALQTVTWTVSESPNGVKIENGVLITTGGVANVGTIEVTATSTVDTSIADTQSITLQAPTAPAPTAVSITSASSTKIGVDLNLIATVQPTDALQTVTWSIDGTPAGVDIINGVLKTTGGIANVGTIEVTATSTVDTSKFDTQSISLQVPTAPVPTGVSITSASSTKIGVDLKLIATVQPTDALQTVTWTLNGSPAGVEIINGVLKTTGGTAAVGTISVTATSTVDTSKFHTQSITLQAPPAPTSVSITSANSIEIGVDLKLTATVQPKEALQTVTWTLNGSISGVEIIDGVLKTTGGVTPTGAIIVTATSTVDTSKSVIQSITLKAHTAPAPTSVSITSRSTEIGVDLKLIATIQPTDALQTVTWTVSGSPNGVKIENGVLITTGGVAAAGTISVTATSTVDTSKSDTQSITLQAPTAPTTVSITSANNVIIGVDLNLTATVQPTDALQTVTWTVSGSPKGVKIENGVLITTGGVATVGEISVTATSTVDISKSDTQTITLQAPVAPAPTAVSITSASSTEIGVDLKLIATIQPTDALQTVTWTLNGSPAGVEIIDGVLKTTGGVATVGEISVTATSTVDISKKDTQTISLQVTTAPAPTSVSITSASSIEIGVDLKLTATVQPPEALQTVTWTLNGSISGVEIIDGVLKTTGGVAPPGAIIVTAISTVDPSKTNIQPITLKANTAPAPTGVSITSASSTKIGVDLNLMATVQPPEALQTVTWTLIGSIPGVEIFEGVLKTTGGVATIGTIEVIAASTVDTTKTNTQTITLQMTTAPAPTSVSITSASSTQIGVDLNLIATIQPTDALQTVTWTLNGSPAGVEITNGVLKTTGGVAAAGTISVIATSTVDTSKTDTQTITLYAIPTSVTINDVTLNPSIGTDLSLIAEVLPAAALQRVTWRITSAPDPATAYTIDTDTGVLTSDADNAVPGDVVVLATSGIGTDAVNSLPKTITFMRPTPTSVTINDVTEKTIIGTELYLRATVSPAGSDPKVTWRIQAPNPAGYSIDPVSGLLTTDANEVKQFTVNVIASSGTLNSPPKTITLYATPTSVTIADVTLNPIVGDRIILIATVLPAGSDPKVTWYITSAPDPATAYTIDTDGVLTSDADNAVPGDVVVAAVTGEGTGVGSTPKTITFVGATDTRVSIDEVTPNPLVGGDPVTLTATVIPMGSDQTVTWSLATPAPIGYTIHSTDGELSSDPNTVTDFTVQVIATSGTGVNAVQSPVRTVTFKPSRTTVSIDKLPSTVASIGTDLQLTAQVSPSAADQTIYWSLLAPPDGYRIDVLNGIIFSDINTAKPGEITVQASDSNSNINTKTITFQEPLRAIIADVAPYPTLGTSLQLRATIPTGSTNVVKWSFTDPASPEGYTLDADSGILNSVPASVTQLTVGVIATLGDIPSATKSITFVRSKGTSITINDIQTLYIGSDLRLSAIVEPAGSDPKVTWRIPHPIPAGYEIDDPNQGVVRTDANVATQFTVNVIASTGNIDSPPKTLTLYARATGVTINDVTVNPVVGTSVNLSARVLPAAALQRVTWTITSAPDPADAYTVDTNSGELTSDADNAVPGDVVVVATYSRAFPSTIINSPPKTITFVGATDTRVSIDEVTPNPLVGTSVRLRATVFPEGSSQTVIWSLAAPAPDGYTINANTGELSSNSRRVTDSRVRVIATSRTGTVSVLSPPRTVTFILSGISVSINELPSAVASIGAKLQLTAQVLPSDADQTTTWSLSNPPDGFSIDANGVLSSDPNVAQPGDVTVIATDSFSNTNTKTITFQMPLRATIDDVTPNPYLGTALTLSATKPAGSSDVVKWSFADPVPTKVYTLDADTGILRSDASMVTEQYTVNVVATLRGIPSATKSITFVRKVESVNVQQPLGFILFGVPLNLKATVLPDGAIQTVTWAIKNNPPGFTLNPSTGELTSDASVATSKFVEVVATSGTGADAIASNPITIVYNSPKATKVEITNTRYPLSTSINLEADIEPPTAFSTEFKSWKLTNSVDGYTLDSSGTLNVDMSQVTTLSVEVTVSVGREEVGIVTSQPTTITFFRDVSSIVLSTTDEQAIIGTDKQISVVVQPIKLSQQVTWEINPPQNGYSIDANGVLSSDRNVAQPGKVLVRASLQKGVYNYTEIIFSR